MTPDKSAGGLIFRKAGRIGVAGYAGGQILMERLGGGKSEVALQPVRPASWQRPLLRVAVVGGGLAGLAAASKIYKLVNFDVFDVEVCVFEAAKVFGGRASVSPLGAEHCSRTMLNSYTAMFEWMREVPMTGSSDASIFDNLVEVDRQADDGTGLWVPFEHSYSIFDPKITVAEQFSLARSRLRQRQTDALALRGQSPLVGASAVENSNLFGKAEGYSNKTLMQMVKNMRRSTELLALSGSTGDLLIWPIVAHLDRLGVKLSTNTAVKRVSPMRTGIAVETDSAREMFDAVVLALAAPDAATLLEASGIRHAIPGHAQTHCKCFTVNLDPREPIFSSGRVTARHAHGLSALIQPEVNRAVVLATKPVSTKDDFVIGKVREMLGLRFDVVDVKTSLNTEPGQGVWAADPVQRSTLASLESSRIYVAGGFMEVDYPLDSGEAAVRSAQDAVLSMLTTFGIATRSTLRAKRYGSA